MEDKREDEDNVAFFERACQPAAGAGPKTPVHVTIPQWKGAHIGQMPRLSGYLTLLFMALTAPEREVAYFYNGRKLRRYLIKGSDKGTRNDALEAKYWLDGEYLGTWNEARHKFESFPWEKPSVADITIDVTNIGEASGVGFWDIPEGLQATLKTHQVFYQVHMRPRKPGDR